MNLTIGSINTNFPTAEEKAKAGIPLTPMEEEKEKDRKERMGIKDPSEECQTGRRNNAGNPLFYRRLCDDFFA